MRALPRSSALALIGGALAAARPATAQTAPQTVRIGATAIDACGEAYYGVDNGMFASSGINAQIATLGNGAAIMAAVTGGDLDVGMTNTPQLAVAISRGIPLQMIAPASLYSKKDADPNLEVAKDSPVKSAADLADATIAVSSLGDFNQLSVYGWFDANKVAHDHVKFVELRFGEMGAALARGTVQAAIMTEPAKTDALRAGQIRDLADTYIAIAPEIATIVWFASKDWLQKNPELARRLVGTIYAIGRWGNANPALSAPILAKVAKMDPAVVATLLRRIYATTNDRRYVEATLALAGRYGMLARPVTFAEYSAF
jgi:NitT/TauT family transport system substrate-binding protein